MNERMSIGILFFVFGYLRTYATWLRNCAKYYLWCSALSLSVEVPPCINHFADSVASHIPTWTLPMRGNGVKFREGREREIIQLSNSNLTGISKWLMRWDVMPVAFWYKKNLRLATTGNKDHVDGSPCLLPFLIFQILAVTPGPLLLPVLLIIVLTL